MEAAEGAETWNAEAEAAMDTARMIAVLHIISARGGGYQRCFACTSHFSDNEKYFCPRAGRRGWKQVAAGRRVGGSSVPD